MPVKNVEDTGNFFHLKRAIGFAMGEFVEALIPMGLVAVYLLLMYWSSKLC